MMIHSTVRAEVLRLLNEHQYGLTGTEMLERSRRGWFGKIIKRGSVQAHLGALEDEGVIRAYVVRDVYGMERRRYYAQN